MPQSHADVDYDDDGEDDSDSDSDDGDGDDNDDTSNGNRLTISLWANERTNDWVSEWEGERHQMCHKNAKDAKIGLRFTFSTLNIHCKKIVTEVKKEEKTTNKNSKIIAPF